MHVSSSDRFPLQATGEINNSLEKMEVTHPTVLDFDAGPLVKHCFACRFGAIQPCGRSLKDGDSIWIGVPYVVAVGRHMVLAQKTGTKMEPW